MRQLIFLALAASAFSLTVAPRSVIESEPLVVTARLPEGWTVDEGRIVPPEAMRAACRVSRTLFQDREWKSVVAAALREAPVWRELLKIGGHEAVWYRTTTASQLTESVYINLDSIEPVGVAIWRVEADKDDAGWKCQRDFAAFVGSLTIDVPGTR
jgi:hypothetical protein